MKKIYTILFFIFLLFVACDKLKPEKLTNKFSVEQTISQWIDAVKKNDVSTAFECLATKSQSSLKTENGKIKETFSVTITQLSKYFNDSEITIEGKDYVESQVWVYLRIKNNNEEKILKYSLVREKDKFGRDVWNIVWE